MSNAPLKIGLDVRGIDPTFKAHSQRGTGRYVRELTSRLLSEKHLGFNFTTFSRENIGLNQIQAKILKNLPRGRVTFESQLCLRKNIKNMGCDFVHFFSHGDAPAYPITPQIVTILDLIPLKFPDLYQSGPLNMRFRLARFLENRAAIAAKGIIAISKTTKKDIIEILKIPEERIFVSYLGVDDSFFSLGEANTVSLNNHHLLDFKNRLGLPIDSLLGLYVGGLDARKNINFLLKIVSELNKNQNFLYEFQRDFKLVIVGNYQHEKTYPNILKSIESLGIKDKVIFLGFVSNEDLAILYRSSDIFIFPSLYEGFGLPVLEAMASSTPLVAGKNSCMLEVLGNSNFILPDNDIIAWVKSISDILIAKKSHDQALQDQLILNKTRAKQFNWENTTKQTIDAYAYFSKFSRNHL